MDGTGKLIIIPTPVGNLGDITLRAIEVLKSVDVLAAEDTRVTGKLLKLLGISCTMISFHSNNEHRSLDRITDMLREGKTVGLCSDAGTPGISDPGFLAVREARSKGFTVECLPGPTAFVPALVASGFPCDKFFFEGFLPHKKGRQTRLEFLNTLPNTIVLYESPHRIVKTLGQIGEFLGNDRQIVVAREISKKFEEFAQGTAEELILHFTEKAPKGEFVVVISPKN